MKKVAAIIVSIIMVFYILTPVAFAKGESNDKLYNDFILALLAPNVMETITEYYGEPRQLDLSNAKVLDIKRTKEESFYFIVTIRVRTCDRGRNPKYGVETITLTNTNKGIRTVDFVHEDEPASDML
ncbi:DUF3888 domain-containing protein [Clostridium bovifaecis]|uniref:DUF3888 domain-containing protein n=1 Tax=Clostridium bovifaecis TaxID=2184719 RepID=A0A6I6F851_9CLOT|nr:DUF3888 domain-containing protein [Clostridium bovifaecis]